MYTRFDILVWTAEYEKSSRMEKANESDGKEVHLAMDEVLMKAVGEWEITRKVFGLTFRLIDGENRKQVTFLALNNDVDDIVDQLTYHGFGKEASNSVVLVNDVQNCMGYPSDEFEQRCHEAKYLPLSKLRVMKTTIGVVSVQRLLDEVHAQAQISVDNLLHLLSACLMALVGLGTNVLIIVVASMFIAPLMNPINLMSFAIRVQQYESFRYGVKTFTIYACLGFLVGFFGNPATLYWIYWRNSVYGEKHFTHYATPEMTARGNWDSVLNGFVLSVVSTISLYTGIINPQSNSVSIGNAISLSLVPPLVNSGMLLNTALIAAATIPSSVNARCTGTYGICGNSTANSSAVNSTVIDSTCKEDLWLRMIMGSVAYEHSNGGPCELPLIFFIQGLKSFTIMMINVIVLVTLSQAIFHSKKFTPNRLGANHIHQFYADDVEEYIKLHTIKKRDPHSTGQFIDSLREENRRNKDGFSDADFDVVLRFASKNPHYKAVGGNYTVGSPIDLSLGGSAKVEEFKRQTSLNIRRSRYLSENQRTIRDFMLSSDFDAIPELTQRKKKCSNEDEPLTAYETHSPRKVGRFHITNAEA